VGMAGILMGSLKMFSQWFPVNRFATASGLLIGIGSLGALLAATPLAWLNNAVGWRVVFVGGAAATALIAGAIMLWTRNTPPGVEWQRGDTSLRGTGEVFSDARFWRIAPLTFFLAGTLLGFQGLWSGPYLFDVYGLNDIQAGNVLLWLGVGATVGYTSSGWLCDRYGISRTISLAAGFFICVQVALAMQPPGFLVPILYFLFGLTGGFNTMLLAQTRMVFPLAMTGKAVTAVNVFAIGGTFVLQWWMGLIIGLFPTDAAGHYPPVAYSVTLLLTATGAAVALIWYRPLGEDSMA
jgi:predicted MFS family arabinose efflux permease